MLNYSKRDNEIYATITGIERDDNEFFQFEEIKFLQKDDGHYLMFGYFSDIKEIKQWQNDNFKFEPQLCQITIHSKDWEKPKYNRELRKYDGFSLVTQGENEKFLCRLIKEKNLISDKALAGYLDLGAIRPTSETMIFDGLDSKGKELSQETRDYLLEQIFISAEVESAEYIKQPPEIKQQQLAKNNNGYAPKPSHYEVLKERQTYLAESLGLPKESNILEISKHITTIAETKEDETELNRTIKLLGLIMLNSYFQ